MFKPAPLQRLGTVRLVQFRVGGASRQPHSATWTGQATRCARRGDSQLSDTAKQAQQSLPKVVQLAPKGVICVASSLAFHGLTDHMPPKVSIANDRKGRHPCSSTSIQALRFSEELHGSGVESHHFADTLVPVLGIAKTLGDLFWCQCYVGKALSIESLRNALQRRLGAAAAPSVLTKSLTVNGPTSYGSAPGYTTASA